MALVQFDRRIKMLGGEDEYLDAFMEDKLSGTSLMGYEIVPEYSDDFLEEEEEEEEEDEWEDDEGDY
jgi:hypothetical protein